MRKFLVIALLFLASALAFGQDGRTKVNFYNQTSSTLRFMLNGNPVCTGDVIPQGFCTEPVNPGTYTASATDSRQTTGGQTFTIEYGETYNYSVTERETQLHNTDPALRTIALHTVALLSYRGAVANAPIDLVTAAGTENRTTNDGHAYTQTNWIGEMPNSDVYIISVAEYPFDVVSNNKLATAVEGFAGGINGKVISTTDTTVSGLPAMGAILESTVQGRTLRFAFLVVFKGNKAYMFAFASFLDVPNTDMVAMNTFFSSAAIQ